MQAGLSWGQIFTGVLLWSIIMMLPVLITYFNVTNPLVSSAMLTMLYPVAIAILTRKGSFWVSYPVIMGASACSLFTWIILSVTKVTDPNVITFVPVSAFIFGMIVLSTQLDMYGSNAVKGGGGGGNMGMGGF
jgi:hypothetical protein